MGESHWSGFNPSPDGSVQISEGFDLENGWTHYLIAHRDEISPRHNHIHIKGKIPKGAKFDSDMRGQWVVCAIKVAGMREVNRRKLIEKVNNITGLNLSYR